MSNAAINVNVPAELNEKLEAQAKAQLTSKSAVVRAALLKHINSQPDSPAPIVQFARGRKAPKQQRQVLTAAHIEPWMLHPDQNPDSSAPHVREVNGRGCRSAFEAIDKANHVLFREACRDDEASKPLTDLLYSLSGQDVPDCYAKNAMELFSSNHYRLGLWAAREYVRTVDELKRICRLEDSAR
jgi:hypothetical protein